MPASLISCSHEANSYTWIDFKTDALKTNIRDIAVNKNHAYNWNEKDVFVQDGDFKVDDDDHSLKISIIDDTIHEEAEFYIGFWLYNKYDVNSWLNLNLHTNIYSWNLFSESVRNENVQNILKNINKIDDWKSAIINKLILEENENRIIIVIYKSQDTNSRHLTDYINYNKGRYFLKNWETYSLLNFKQDVNQVTPQQLLRVCQPQYWRKDKDKIVKIQSKINLNDSITITIKNESNLENSLPLFYSTFAFDQDNPLPYILNSDQDYNYGNMWTCDTWDSFSFEIKREVSEHSDAWLKNIIIILKTKYINAMKGWDSSYSTSTEIQNFKIILKPYPKIRMTLYNKNIAAPYNSIDIENIWSGSDNNSNDWTLQN